MGGQSSDLVELILRRVNGAAQPDPLIAELERRQRQGWDAGAPPKGATLGVWV